MLLSSLHCNLRCALILLSSFHSNVCRMDPGVAYRVDVRVGAYVEFTDDGRQEYHVSRDINWVLDRDTSCFLDLLKDLDDEVRHGSNQTLAVTIWNKKCSRYTEVASDSALLDAFDMYWDIRRLPLVVSVSGSNACRQASRQASTSNLSCAQQATSSQQTLASAPDLPTQDSTACPDNEPGPCKPAAAHVDKWAEAEADDDQEDYVGVDDERLEYKDLMSGDDTSDQEYVPADDDDDDQSESSVDDEAGCQTNVHVTDIENLNIDVGVTFEDGQCFKRCIRQYAMLNEV